MALPLLRGLRQFETAHPELSPVLGAVLLYPDLFGPAPAAGDEPGLGPLVHTIGSPLFILQPSLGSLRQHMPQVLDALWARGSSAFVRLVPGVRDWYPMEPPNEDQTQDAASARLPAEIQAATRLLSAAPRVKTQAKPSRSHRPPLQPISRG